ncbi:hypothetical protein GN958_ATG00859 [Phytophthora infestans]|uniref:Isopenicillin N synthase-like Fe(2+) 2OG dioxygenase domain-containing protein n=1 Tax=Phytophthora infestans TaxID=4787 RepID=A0A8S9VAB4_PHYIN|nr:hypothetical protein GN958_ATG00859 [Phytophthora infestans]
MVQVWSSDQFVAPLHRVLANGGADLFLAPFFYNPSYEFQVEPIVVKPGDVTNYCGCSYPTELDVLGEAEDESHCCLELCHHLGHDVMVQPITLAFNVSTAGCPLGQPATRRSAKPSLQVKAEMLLIWFPRLEQDDTK